MHCTCLFYEEVRSLLSKEDDFFFFFKSVMLVALLKWLGRLQNHCQTNIQMCKGSGERN